MLEFGKTILEKVSFDALLFKKELRKLKKWMSEREIGSFEEWCKERFGKMYPKIISDCFKRKTDTESL